MKLQLIFLFIVGISYCKNNNDFISSGLTDIDKVRIDVYNSNTTFENADERRATLYRWWRLLLNQGYDLTEFDEIANMLLNLSNDKPEGCMAITEGYICLEKLQREGKKILEVREKKKTSATKTSQTNWSQYHGTTTEQTGYSPDLGPSVGNIVWKFPKSYGCHVSPVIENGKIYLTGTGGDVISYCLDEKSGKVIWKGIINNASYYHNSGRKSSTKLTDSTVVVMSGNHPYIFRKSDGKVVNNHSIQKNSNISEKNLQVFKTGIKTILLIDVISGKTIWQYHEEECIAGNPVIFEDLIFYTSYRGNLKVLSILNGETHTPVLFDEKVVGTPVIDNNIIYIGSNSGKLFAYHVKNQKVIWTFSTNQLEERSKQLFSKVHVNGDKLYFGASNKNVYCLDKKSGKLIWDYAVDHWIKATPVYYDNTLYAATLNGTIYAIQENKGKAICKWRKKVAEHGFETDLAASENGIYGITQNFILHSIATSGKQQWKHSIFDGVFIDDKFYAAEGKGGQQSSPVVVNNTLYIGGTDGYVNAIDVDTGIEKWRFETAGVMASSPTAAYGKIFFGEAYNSSGTYYAVDANTGSLVWSTKEYGNVWVNATYNDGLIYFGNMDGYFFCADANTGKKLWSYNTAKDTPLEKIPIGGEERHGFPPGVYCNPVFYEGVVYTGSWSGYYFALDSKTGKLKWRTKTSPDNEDGGYPDSAAPVLYKNHLYVQKGGYQLAALNKDSGKIDWIWTAPPGYLQNGTVAAFDNKIFASVVRGVTELPYDAKIIAINDVENGGDELWRYDGGGGLTAAVGTKDKLIFASSGDVHATCLDPDTGKVVWKTMIGGTMLEVVPAVYGNKAFFQCKNGFLYAIE